MNTQRSITYYKNKIKKIKSGWSFSDSREFGEANKTNCFGLGYRCLNSGERNVIDKYKKINRELEKYTNKLKELEIDK